MKTISGRLRRTLLKSQRLATESWHITVDGDLDQDLSPGELVLDEYPFEDVARDEPSVICSRRITVDQARVLSSALRARQVPEPPAVAMPLELDATPFEPLHDDEFWKVLDLLGGRAWQTRLTNVERTLAKRTREFLLRFEQSMSLMTYVLDHPRNYNVESRTHVVFKGDYRWKFGAIIAGGKARFESVRTAPGTWDTTWLSDSSFMVLYLAREALRKLNRVEQVAVNTSWGGQVPWSGVTVDPSVRR